MGFSVQPVQDSHKRLKRPALMPSTAAGMHGNTQPCGCITSMAQLVVACTVQVMVAYAQLGHAAGGRKTQSGKLRKLKINDMLLCGWKCSQVKSAGMTVLYIFNKCVFSLCAKNKNPLIAFQILPHLGRNSRIVPIQ